MSKHAHKHKTATADLDPATLAKHRTYRRIAERIHRMMLKKRRQKSGQ
jgi:hypothetical protein